MSSPHPHRGAGAGRSVSLALLTVSDTRTEHTDESGRAMRRLLEEAGHRVFEQRILRDEPAEVRAAVEHWLRAPGCDGVLVSGGTGISPRDRTYEAVEALIEQTLDGFGELFRQLSFGEIGSAAMLSRAVGGVARGRVVFAMPGSTAAVTLAMSRLILPELGHLLAELRRLGPGD